MAYSLSEVLSPQEPETLPPHTDGIGAVHVLLDFECIALDDNAHDRAKRANRNVDDYGAHRVTRRKGDHPLHIRRTRKPCSESSAGMGEDPSLCRCAKAHRGPCRRRLRRGGAINCDSIAEILRSSSRASFMKKPDSKMRDFENGTRNTEDENFDLHPAAAERRERTDHETRVQNNRTRDQGVSRTAGKVPCRSKIGTVSLTSHPSRVSLRMLKTRSLDAITVLSNCFNK